MELADDLNNNDNQDWSNYEAKSLSSHIEMQAEPSPLNEFETIALNLSNGLAHLHENGLVHRDIKPSNVIFVNGVAKLADIGLVSFGSDASTFIGTTGYIPPEGPGSPQADVYALGKTLYELLTAKSVQFFPELPTTVFNDKKHSDQFSEYNLKSLSFSMYFFAFIKSSFMSTEKLLPFMIVVLTFKPISIALSNSIPSIFSSRVCGCKLNLLKAFGLKEIIDKCFK